ncbi:DEAD/DEAH box helicase [Paenibacillus hexagrammi]|uniref:DEAD/DEAH box helicase n=1 Tax=Paenibacillus hexagrammi TaxID=2908839 RepID=A0ABY3SJ26_9BACL|nr:DEAD/DEAH box helicase [Paenibacillus sp. YPD9-1]UJF33234.1 DEAD/DEAH box helicase [Paenibacillus sp. YPD9-1]
MKGQLYALRVGSTWTWNLTIHMPTNIQYWFEQYGADVGMVLLEPSFSIGQAVRLLHKLTSEPTLITSSQCLPTLRQAAKFCGFANSLIQAFHVQVIAYSDWMDGKYPPVRLNADLYRSMVLACTGRSLLTEEFEQVLDFVGIKMDRNEWMPYVQLSFLHGDMQVTNGLAVQESRDWRRGFRKQVQYRCKRCGSGDHRLFWSECLYCGQECPYCEECLTMGRTRYCSLLILGAEAAAEQIVNREYAVWGTGEDVSRGARGGAGPQVRPGMAALEPYLEPWGLSDAQKAASLEGLQFLENRGKYFTGKGQFLIWAVTGAGKTEMIFPFIHYTVARGGRALIATPRKDVVLELQPRISKAFSDYSVVTLYGGSEQRWEQGQITIGTTHQLLRFHEAFDLVIIDEIDAFPYHNNPMLEYAAMKVCKPSGNTILLSATPPKPIRAAAERGRLPHVRVPVRYHRNPLPVPRLLTMPPVQSSISKRAIPTKLVSLFRASLDRGAQLFVFVPNIKLVEPMVELLRLELYQGEADAGSNVQGTSSKDTLRTEKVQQFRRREIRLLVTTTILERGVTVPKSDVFILDADSGLFDEAALVQMAGRAGRSMEDPAGLVYFASKDWTSSQKEAVRQIKQMNRIARRQGYLKEG